MPYSLQRFTSPRLSISLKFIIGCSIALIIIIGISFYVIAHHQERLIIGQLENEARAIHRQIVITRQWIADHGGIFIEKLPWVRPSPYVNEAEIRDTRGKRYIKETPAMVTKEISKYARDRGLFWFHITSLKLVNPENAPDGFEKIALLEFEKKGIKEKVSIETIEGSKYLRFIAPLYVEMACLKCHAKQGYKIGDIRGAISVIIPADKTLAELSANKQRMVIASVLILLSLILTMFLMMKKLVLNPVKRLKSSIMEFSDKGQYSSENILKTGDEFEDLYCAFAQMAREVSEYHNCLNDRVQAATKDLEELNRKLIEANRLLSEANIKKSDFIARASHELRTPLTSINGAMDYISARLQKALQQNNGDTSLDDIYIFFDVIKRNSERLIHMVNDMLDMEKIEMGVSEFHFIDINLSHLITDTLTSFKANAVDADISFNINIPPQLHVNADEDRIRQVLVNLLSNAFKFSPPKAEIIVFSYVERGFVVTEIWDNGPGIPLSEQGKVFEKFYKNGSKEGTGLGLAICKSIIEAHKGIIGIKSDGKNGSCFYFKLPYILERVASSV